MLPSLPTIPTDSLHRFLAITGLLLMIVPTLYLSNRADTVREEVIHLNAERKVLKIQNEVITKRHNDLGFLVFGRDVAGYSKAKLQPLKDSLLKLRKLALIRLDSAEAETKRINRLTTAIDISTIHLNEKDEIIEFNLDRIKRYTFYAGFFFAIGAGMATFGFLRWYDKEKSN